MAKSATKKAKSVKLGDGVKIKVKVGKKASASKGGAKKGGSKKSGKSKGEHNPIETLARLAESPIISDLIAIGATAAVAALANRGSKPGNHAKNAGKAAATAIGARLMTEFKAVKASAKEAAAKDSAKKA